MNYRGEPVNSVALNWGRAREPRGSSRRDYPSEGRRPRTKATRFSLRVWVFFFFFFSTLTFEARALKPEHGDRDAVAAEGKLSPGSPSSYVYARPPAQPAVDILTPRTSRSNCERPILAATSARSGRCSLQRRLGSVRTTWTVASLHPLFFFLPPRLRPILGNNADSRGRVFTAFEGKHRRRFDLSLLKEELIRPDSSRMHFSSRYF